ncbi:MAG: hypothetical protein ABFQ82_04225 [Thermodesulfobacteriota bacterium]
MNFHIAGEIISDTACDKDSSCLHGDKAKLCRVERSLGKHMLTLECKDILDCRHNKIYGGMHICNCQVRIEIYKLYAL